MVKLSTTLNHKGKKYKVHRGKKGGIYIIRQNKKIYLQNGSGVLGIIRMKAIKKFVSRMPRMKQKGGVRKGEWKCSFCETINKPGSLACEMCRTEISPQEKLRLFMEGEEDRRRAEKKAYQNQNQRWKNLYQNRRPPPPPNQNQNRRPPPLRELNFADSSNEEEEEEKRPVPQVHIDDIFDEHRPKPTVLVLQSINSDDVFHEKGDPNLEKFFKENEYAKTYTYRHRKVENVDDMINKIEELGDSKIAHLIIMGHGSPLSLQLSPKDDINPRNVKKLSEHLGEKLIPGAVILLHSCCVGYGGPKGNNLARKLTDLLPDNDVYAAQANISMGDLSFNQFVPDEEKNQLLHIQYSVDNKKVRKESRKPYEIYRFSSPKSNMKSRPLAFKIDNNDEVDNEPWLCLVCSFENKAGTLACEICGHPRGTRAEDVKYGGKVFRYKLPEISVTVKKIKKKAVRGKKKVIRGKKKTIRRKKKAITEKRN